MKIVAAAVMLLCAPLVFCQTAGNDRPARRDQGAITKYDPAAELARVRGEMSSPVDPFKVVGNVYYVGASGISSYLIVTSAGLILVDTGSITMADSIPASIKKLGFDPANLKYILSTHAHFDHVEGHAKIVKATGAKVVALGADAEALAQGVDKSALGFLGWEPVKVDRVIKDGETVELGGVTMRAMALPGHTPGGTSWFTQVTDGGRTYNVMFFVSLTPNAGIDIVNNPRHPNVIQDTARSIQKVHALAKPDIVLLGHPDREFLVKGARVAAGEHVDFTISDAAWADLIKSQRFYDQLYSQTHAKPSK